MGGTAKWRTGGVQGWCIPPVRMSRHARVAGDGSRSVFRLSGERGLDGHGLVAVGRGDRLVGQLALVGVEPEGQGRVRRSAARQPLSASSTA